MNRSVMETGLNTPQIIFLIICIKISEQPAGINIFKLGPNQL